MATVQSKEIIGRSLLENLLGNYIRFDFTPDTYNRIDFRGEDEEQGYCGDVKCYRDENHPRYHNYNVTSGKHYSNYQIDYDKCESVEKVAEEEHRTPWIVAFFTDYVYIWDLSKIDWKSTRRIIKTNDKGINYGKSKSLTAQAYLEFKDAVFTDNPQKYE